MSTPSASATTRSRARTSAHGKALALGLLGVGLFALSLPMTRLAVGSTQAPQLSPEFVALGRAAVAGVLAALWLVWQRAPLPGRRDWALLAAMAGGVVFGFPLLTSIALREVDAVHASLILALLPLFTAALGALLAGQRPSAGFWLCALLGAALVMTYALLHGSGPLVLKLRLADGLLAAAMLSAAVGYALGGHLTRSRPAGQVIGWALVLSLPLTVPAAWWLRPVAPVQLSAWSGFAYVAVVSMWLGFLAWYRALALGGTVRISQLQLLQPFLSMLAAAALLHEVLDLTTLLFAGAVLAVVFVARRMPVHEAPHPVPGSRS
ncbi:DMT family transporter [Thiomonas intermedia]|uniref:DMT family transporter n=1 Tax=Thiomonas intermedia TaxID=926 RepID=UPI0009A4762A|nr:DMT family transporter [Thiomonas intermedia]